MDKILQKYRRVKDKNSFNILTYFNPILLELSRFPYILGMAFALNLMMSRGIGLTLHQ